MSQSAKQANWQLLSRKPAYQGHYKIDQLSFTHSLYSGACSAVVEQELFVRGNVVALVPYDAATDQIALIEQFRIGAMHQSTGPWMTEIIAGMIDTDETPEQVVIREAYEEAGIRIKEAQLIRQYLASPGSSTDEVFIFYAETDLSQISGIHGLACENEDIRVRVVPVEQAFQMLDTHEIRNAVSIVALQWLKLKRAGL